MTKEKVSVKPDDKATNTTKSTDGSLSFDIISEELTARKEQDATGKDVAETENPVEEKSDTLSDQETEQPVTASDQDPAGDKKKDLPVYQLLYKTSPKCIRMPTDKYNRSAFNSISGTDFGETGYNEELQTMMPEYTGITIPVDVTPRKSNLDDIKVDFTLDFTEYLEEFSKDVITTDGIVNVTLDAIDFRIMTVISAFISSGRDVISVREIADGAYGNHKTETCRDVHDRIAKMSRTRLYLNNEAETKKGLNYPKITLQGTYLMRCEKAIIKESNHESDAYVFYTASVDCIANEAKKDIRALPLVAMAINRKQYVSLSWKQYKKISKATDTTPRNKAIEQYLIMMTADRKLISNEIKYSTLYDAIGIDKDNPTPNTLKVRKSRCRKTVETILEELKLSGHIDDYDIKSKKDRIIIARKGTKAKQKAENPSGNESGTV